MSRGPVQTSAQRQTGILALGGRDYAYDLAVSVREAHTATP